MLEFCCFCSNLLFAEENLQGNVQFTCKLCPIYFRVKKLKLHKNYSELKKIDDILGGEEAWKNVDSTEERCPKCSHDRAYFLQMQTRSADEPMTTFYRCCNPECNHYWRD
ncbi:RNA polymerase III subunit K [Leptinotarsa decemlineata]|uniref:RNA polymerase III subunit K n=1 Tax=Leptinotarsa decemlineata TaxID=7539 RepID=UPI000C255409|nr:DNA-directed RNA polymerase III subunit RPC10 [Leptinotarsa decemlineata]XP_023025417.1 DNA-directed RNA polymerase III subunit RPC10 [Leptinotarsa decemlineata]